MVCQDEKWFLISKQKNVLELKKHIRDYIVRSLFREVGFNDRPAFKGRLKEIFGENFDADEELSSLMLLAHRVNATEFGLSSFESNTMKNARERRGMKRPARHRGNARGRKTKPRLPSIPEDSEVEDSESDGNYAGERDAGEGEPVSDAGGKGEDFGEAEPVSDAAGKGKDFGEGEPVSDAEGRGEDLDGDGVDDVRVDAGMRTDLVPGGPLYLGISNGAFAATNERPSAREDPPTTDERCVLQEVAQGSAPMMVETLATRFGPIAVIPVSGCRVTVCQCRISSNQHTCCQLLASALA